MQHQDAPPDQSTEEDPCNSISAFESQFKQAFAKGLRVRWPQICPDGSHSAGQDNVAGGERVWKREDLVLNGFAVVLNSVVHKQMITNMLFTRKRRVEGGVGCLTFEVSWRQRRDAPDSKRKMGRRPSA